MNYKMIVQYDGTRYDGWQRQGNTDNTIQGKIEETLTRITGEPVEIFGAGRTDAGVHALGQAANFHLQTANFTGKELVDSLNRFLPEDIGILSAEEVPERFHCRLNAKGKTYCYRIGTGERKNVFERRQIYPVEGSLDRAAMERAAGFLKGEHDFKGFCANKRMKKSTVRNIWNITFEETQGELRIVYTGDGFLYHMIRIMTGTLIETGQGRRTPESVLEILEKKDRALAGYTAPARGLTLVEVFYPDDIR
ncbi:MAG: tRNA pseudouridine(38-40) synthase TruA [Candidatus Limivivens sp.]|nr:tRNA pseudouridine(38-40) synthase TruA [Candidatus Limivivens sp.]